MNLQQINTFFSMNPLPFIYHPYPITVIIYDKIFRQKTKNPYFVIAGKPEMRTLQTNLATYWGSLPNGQRIQIAYLDCIDEFDVDNPNGHWFALDIKKYGENISLIIFDSRGYMCSLFSHHTTSILPGHVFINDDRRPIPCDSIQTDEDSCGMFALDTLFQAANLDRLHGAMLWHTRNIAVDDEVPTPVYEAVFHYLRIMKLRNVQNYNTITTARRKPDIAQVMFGKNRQTLASYWDQHNDPVRTNDGKMVNYNYGIKHKAESWRQKVCSNDGILAYLNHVPARYQYLIDPNNRMGINFLTTSGSISQYETLTSR